MSFSPESEHDFTAEIGGEYYGIVEWKTDYEFRRAGSADIHRTFLSAGPAGSIELPVNAMQAVSITGVTPILLILAVWALRRKRRPA